MSDRFVGIDVSKGYADIIILDQDGIPVLKLFRLDDTVKGHNALQKIFTDMLSKDSTLTFYAAVESTGGLENNWLHQLRIMGETLPVHSARINPKGIHQYVKADMTRTITDGVSARAIASYQIAHRKKIRYDEGVQPLERLRPTWASYSLLKKQLQQVSNSLHPLLYRANPGVILYCRRGIPTWLLRVLKQYPTAKKLSCARLSTLSRIPYVNEEKARRLITIGKEQTGSDSGPAMEQTIMVLLDHLLHLETVINKMEKTLIALARDNKQVKLFTTFRGIGEPSAIGLVMNMPNIDATIDSGKLASYWGLHPVYKQSGDGKTVPRMSKAGRSQPRAILFMVAMASVVHNPHIRKLYAKSLRKGMKPMAALGVCMHKIARILYGMCKSGKAFDAAIDEKNSNKPVKSNTPSPAKRHIESLRRLQPHDPIAPISRRERKKRTVLVESQDTLVSSTGSSSVGPSK